MPMRGEGGLGVHAPAVHAGFLLQLSDAMAAAPDATTVESIATEMLGRYLATDRVLYLAANGLPPRHIVSSEYHGNPEMPSLVGCAVEAVLGGKVFDRLKRAGVVIVPDFHADADLSSDGPECVADLASFAVVPVLRSRGPVGGIAVASTTARDWTTDEVALLREVAERSWQAKEHAGAEAALRASEERLRQFGEASLDILWIRDAATLRWVYLTPAFEAIYGISREDALAAHDSSAWTELIVHEDRGIVDDGIAKVRAGERAVFEYRVRRPEDHELRWLRDTVFPIAQEAGGVALIGGVTHDITPIKASERHAAHLLAELQHRVRNMLAVIRSIIRRTAEQSDTLEQNTSHLEGRINAFARLQAAATRNLGSGIDLASIVAEGLRAAGAREGDNATIAGPPLELQPKAAETINLAVHELTTNAVKFGALSEKSGHVTVRWQAEDGMLRFSWTETGMHELRPATRRGFGLEILEHTLPYELKANVRFRIEPTGLRFDASIPLTGTRKTE